MTDTSSLSGRRIVEMSARAAGGVKAHLWQCARVLAQVGAEVTVLAPAEVLDVPYQWDDMTPAPSSGNTAQEYAASSSVGSIQTRACDMGSLPTPRDLVAMARIRAAAAHADLVHAHGLRAGALAALALPRHTPLLVTLHNLPVGSLPVRAMGRCLETIVARRATYLLAVSPDLEQRVLRHGAHNIELAIIPAPERDREEMLEGETSASEMTQGSGDRREMLRQGWRLLTVARLAPQKGLDLLCDTAAELRRVLPDTPWHWNVAGAGPLEEHVRERIAREQLPVTLLGRREDVRALMAQADIYVQTSLWEGQPLTIQEALLAGTPIVATDVGGTSETSRGGAILTHPRPEKLAQALAALMSEQSRYEQSLRMVREAAAALPGQAELRRQLERIIRRCG